MRLAEASHKQRTSDPGLNLRQDGTLRHRPSDGPLPPSATWKVGDVCRAPSASAGGDIKRAVIQEWQENRRGSNPRVIVKFLEYAGDSPVTEAVPIGSLLPLSDEDFVVSAARSGRLGHSMMAGAAPGTGPLPGFLTK